MSRGAEMAQDIPEVAAQFVSTAGERVANTAGNVVQLSGMAEQSAQSPTTPQSEASGPLGDPTNTRESTPPNQISGPIVPLGFPESRPASVVDANSPTTAAAQPNETPLYTFDQLSKLSEDAAARSAEKARLDGIFGTTPSEPTHSTDAKQGLSRIQKIQRGIGALTVAGTIDAAVVAPMVAHAQDQQPTPVTRSIDDPSMQRGDATGVDLQIVNPDGSTSVITGVPQTQETDDAEVAGVQVENPQIALPPTDVASLLPNTDTAPAVNTAPLPNASETASLPDIGPIRSINIAYFQQPSMSLEQMAPDLRVAQEKALAQSTEVLKEEYDLVVELARSGHPELKDSYDWLIDRLNSKTSLDGKGRIWMVVRPFSDILWHGATDDKNPSHYHAATALSIYSDPSSKNPQLIFSNDQEFDSLKFTYNNSRGLSRVFDRDKVVRLQRYWLKFIQDNPDISDEDIVARAKGDQNVPLGQNILNQQLPIYRSIVDDSQAMTNTRATRHPVLDGILNGSIKP